MPSSRLWQARAASPRATARARSSSNAASPAGRIGTGWRSRSGPAKPERGAASSNVPQPGAAPSPETSIVRAAQRLARAHAGSIALPAPLDRNHRSPLHPAAAAPEPPFEGLKNLHCWLRPARAADTGAVFLESTRARLRNSQRVPEQICPATLRAGTTGYSCTFYG